MTSAARSHSLITRAAVALLVLLTVLAFFTTRARIAREGVTIPGPVQYINVELQDIKDFWSTFHQALKLRHPGDKIALGDYIGGTKIRTLRPPPRYNKIMMTNDQHIAIQAAHRDFLADLKTRNYSIPYQPNTRGIVFLAGGKYAIPSLVSLRVLRDTGCSLPVEIFVKDEGEYDKRLCEDLYPALNARCIRLDTILGAEFAAALAGYQLKAFAVLSSSFEDNMFLDADSMPLRDVTPLFDQKPYSSTGYVLWPDLWYRSEAPLYFDIINMTMPTIDANHRTTEAGQVMYSKKTHQDTLLLMAYYNYYGPDWWWNLIMQHTHGRGDKETFRAAVDITGEPVYVVQRSAIQVGSERRHDSPVWRHIGLIQFDPTDEPKKRPARPLFAHLQDPKLDPREIFASDRSSFIFNRAGDFHRTWLTRSLDPLIQEVFADVDYELGLWESVRNTTCAYDMFPEDACQLAEAYVKYVRVSPYPTDQVDDNTPYGP